VPTSETHAPFYPQLTIPTAPVKCKASTQKQLSRSIRILKHRNRIRLTAECVCCAGMLITGKGEEQDQKIAAIKRVIYTFASATTAGGLMFSGPCIIVITEE